MSTVSANEFRSRPSRVLEGIMLAFPVLLGISLLAMAGVTGSDLATVAAVGVLGIWVAALVLGLAIPVALFLDAKGLQGHEREWEPNPVLYAVLGFLFSGLTLLHYLYKRQETFGTEPAEGRWWYVAVGLVVAGILTYAAYPLVGPTSFMGSYALLALAPIPLYMDTKYVRTADAGWRPNPTTQLVVAMVCLLSTIGAPFYLGYYAFKRARSVGLR